ncbi:ATP-dependent DNA helicase-like protein [Emericellopsis cladophorae]|uniref:DNA 3'-5' helicase n=1 Tax=Emericellopsis cladophorae TaxID=2686198 RepID=A0A9P9Y801_9HYPO|nr:ATP-dependent DNA helicase-like protein [Emericellopsis cladophorae]KAI6784484.1 ATP-dependent DNA helicase-like protein [Emericellopsis cladophorae]
MRERIGKLLGEDVEKKIVLGTFHSISRRYLSAYGKRIGLDSNFSIADDGDSKGIIKRICERLKLTVEPSYAKSWISKRKAKGNHSTTSQKGKKADHPDLLKCYEEYQEHLQRSNLLDYDDLLVRCVELLEKNASCVSNVQSVLIDEYQDTNGIQYELMKLFAQKQGRITVVGDPDQSIYGWRSAEVRNLYRLLREFPGTDEVSLEENYRSSQSILDISLRVIQEDKRRYQKALTPVHAKGTRPVLRKLTSSSNEGEWIVSEIKRLILMLGGMLKHEDVAILLRSAALSRHVESALGKAGISYRMIGGHKFYERKEIKVLIDYLRVVYQPENNDAVARIINVPRRGIGEATVKSLLAEAELEKLSVWTVIIKHCRGDRKATTNIRAKMEQRLSSELMRIINGLQQKAADITASSSFSLVDLIEQLISQLNYKKYLEDEYANDHETRWANVREFVNLVSDYLRDSTNTEDDELPEVDEVEQSEQDSMLGKFLANVSLASDAQRGSGKQDQSSMITISTIHAAKGLEWPIVFVPSVYTGSMPHSRAEDIDEERRLLYVAMTRAQALLYLSCPLYGPQGFSNKVELSDFVAPFAEVAFASKGPSVDEPVIQTIGKILDRDPPQSKVIFEKLPPMTSVEDDRFPENPFDPKNSDEIGDARLPRGVKRQRTDLSENSKAYVDEHQWDREYATTMEQSSAFTMSSLPGFVSVSQHQHTIAAANKAKEQATARKATITKGTNRRPADQKSLLNYVNQGSRPQQAAPSAADRSAFSSYSRYQAAASKFAAWTASEPLNTNSTLPQHKLPVGNQLARPSGRQPDNENRKRYACFSSSPTKPASPEKAEQEVSRDDPKPLARPATSFHATTFTAVRSLPRGVRRPVGMGPAPSMDRLRKPFKPLTINRPSGPERP